MDNMDTPPSITDLLSAWAGGNLEALNELMQVVYTKLREKARQAMAGERPTHTLSPTALVHEVYLELHRLKHVSFEGRGKFFAYVAVQMRTILREHARTLQAKKRGGEAERMTLAESSLWADPTPIDFLDLDAALRELEEVDPLLVRMVELRFFAGLTEDETAEALDRSRSWVQREWRVAKRFLADKLQSR
jgi:RNA polymerase sigma factor (TIGR02999 family)